MNIYKIINKLSIILAFEMSIACLLSYQAGILCAVVFNFGSSLISALWCTLSAILVMQSTWKQSISSGFRRMIGSFIGSVVPMFIFSILGSSVSTYIICIFSIVILCSYFNKQENLRLALLTTSVIYVVSTIDITSNIFIISISRLIESLLGISITLCTRYLTIRIHLLIDDNIDLIDQNK